VSAGLGSQRNGSDDALAESHPGVTRLLPGGKAGPDGFDETLDRAEFLSGGCAARS
jgi:hypothetical protein